MKIVLCPDSFKGSLSSLQVCQAIKEGFLHCSRDFEIVEKPLADGGEGFIESIYLSLGGTFVHKIVTGPLWEKVPATFLVLPDEKTAVIEMAQAAGLTLIPEEKRNPRFTTTLGVGELILEAISRGYYRIILGVGGSATNDGGMGALNALGVTFISQDGTALSGMGDNFTKIQKINSDKVTPEVKQAEILIATDVKNLLFGPEGAAVIYGPQKGASLEDVQYLDEGLVHYSQKIFETSKREIHTIPGSGAAGGIGAGLSGFLNTKFVSGIQLVIDLIQLEKEVENADLVISGEGKIDRQTLYGKVISGVYDLTKKYNKPLLLLAGMVDEDVFPAFEDKVLAIFSIANGPISEELAFNNAYKLTENTAFNIAKVLLNPPGK